MKSIDAATFAFFSQKPEPLGSLYRRFMLGEKMVDIEVANMMDVTGRAHIDDICRIRDAALGLRAIDPRASESYVASYMGLAHG